MVLYCNIHIDTLLQNIVIFKLLMILYNYVVITVNKSIGNNILMQLANQKTIQTMFWSKNIFIDQLHY